MKTPHYFNTKSRFALPAIVAAACFLMGVHETRAQIAFTPTELYGATGPSFSGFSFPSSNNDLTSLGTTDWAYYGSSSGTIFEANSKAGGVGLGLPTFFNTNRNGTLQDGTGGNVGTHFTYSDGTSPSSASDVTAAGASSQRGGSITFNNDPGPTFRISAPVDISTNTLYVWLSASKANGNGGVNAFNITLWDGVTQIGSTYNFDGTSNDDAGSAYIYEINYGGGTTLSGNLDFQFQMTGGNQDDATFALNATALSAAAVPEPSTYVLLSFGLGVLWFLRRQKKVW